MYQQVRQMRVDQRRTEKAPRRQRKFFESVWADSENLLRSHEKDWGLSLYE
jgi:hypothetical protein